MFAASLVLATALSNQSVDVRSSSACPSSEEIAERLAPLLPKEAALPPEPDIATVAVIEDAAGAVRLWIRLVRAGGNGMGERLLEMQPGRCSEAAATAAAVIAAWETAPRLPPQTGAMVPATTAPVVAVPPTTPRTWRVSLGAGGGAAIVGGVAAVGTIEALVGKPAGRLRARLGVSAETSRQQSLDPGEVSWRHTTFAAGLLWRTLNPRWPLSFDADLTLGWATLEGHSFSSDGRSRSFEPGASAAVRWGRSFAGWTAWTEVRAHAWPVRQHAWVAGAAGTGVDLPQADVSVGLGLSTPLF